MDDFSPIRVDPEPGPGPGGEGRDRPVTGPTPGGPAKPRLDAADVGLAAAQNLVILGVIERQMDATQAGAAEVSGAADQPLVATVDPLDPEYEPPPTDGSGGGCLTSAFVLLVALTLAARSAVAAAW